MTDTKLECTVLVNSCDDYSEAWEPFFLLFKKFWSDCPFNIVLATQTKEFTFEGVTVLHTEGESWSERINSALKQIKTPFVILFLEDYFLHAQVKTEKVLFYLDAISNDQEVGAFYFNKIGNFQIPSSKYTEFYDMNSTDLVKYHLNCQIAIWRKSIFEEATSIPMSPWEFEVEGFSKVPNHVRNAKFYCSKKSVHSKIQEDDVFACLISPETGIGISKSRWLWNNKHFFRKNGIDCKCKTLGHMSHFEYRVRCSYLFKLLAPKICKVISFFKR